MLRVIHLSRGPAAYVANPMETTLQEKKKIEKKIEKIEKKKKKLLCHANHSGARDVAHKTPVCHS